MKKVTVLMVVLILSMAMLSPGTSLSGGWGGDQLLVSTIRPGGVCESPTDADDPAAYFHLDGKLPTSLVYRVNPATFPKGLDPAQVRAAINNAFSTWETIPDLGDRFSAGDNTSAKSAKRDGVNAIYWGGAPSGSIAAAYTWVDSRTGLVVEADIVLGKGFKWATNVGANGDCGGAAGAMDVENILTHEVGHVVRLGHISNNAQTMYDYASYQELHKRTLGQGDTAGVAAKYP